MPFLKTLHLIFICVWLGFVLIETVIEFMGKEDPHHRIAALLHYRIDLFLEIPTVTAVLATGVLLSLRSWPLSSLLIFKIALGLVAIAINYYCAALVVRRHRRSKDPASLDSFTRRIRRTWLGIPFGLGALYLGLAYFAR